jgi:hypothetical protein
MVLTYLNTTHVSTPAGDFIASMWPGAILILVPRASAAEQKGSPARRKPTG